MKGTPLHSIPWNELVCLNSDQIKTDPQSLQIYGKDWTTYFDIKSSGVLFPKTTEQVSEIVRWARKNKINLIPSGGRTGLSGGACAIQDEVIVSFDLMNQILDFNEIEKVVHLQSGVITESLQNFASSHGLFYPVDFAARGSSQIGGNVATNAGGIKVVKFGLTRDWVVGLTVVTGTGDILKLGHSLVKNNTGYDFRHLFIGSEGTLGFITEVSIQLTEPTKDPRVLIVGSSDLEKLPEVFAHFQSKTNLLAFEMFTHQALQKVLKHTGLKSPFQQTHSCYALLEIDFEFSDTKMEQAMEAFSFCADKEWVTDGVFSQSNEESKLFWRLREDISESLAPFSPYKNDISVTLSKVPILIRGLDQIIQKNYPFWEVVWFGHLGDGNLHINILRPSGMTKDEFVKECQKVDVFIFEEVQKLGGSISAEHGIGLTKKNFLSYTRSITEINLMKEIKKLFDPDLILNKGKLFDI